MQHALRHFGREPHAEDLAGPGEFILSPEGRIVIIKERDPESSR
jgi:hypothetical protein